MAMKSHVSHSLEETAEIASNWLQDITEKYSGADEALVVGLSGHLGAGKTAFVKAVASKLGVKEEITSPTFVIMKIYEIKNPNWQRLIHIDAYRLEKREELEVLQWEKLIADKHNLIIIEWPEKVGISDLAPLANLDFEIVKDLHNITVN